ncbi:MAG: glycosyltransferase family 29 protein [Pararhizobium sp.]
MRETAAGRIAVVGNAPLERDFSGEIDAADIVLRFNAAPEHGRHAGTKTDRLLIANSGKTSQRLIGAPGFRASAVVAAAGIIDLVFHPAIIAAYHPKPGPIARLKGRRHDLTGLAIDVFGAAGKPVRVLPPAFYERGCEVLKIAGIDRRRRFPSTGFLALLDTVDHLPPDSEIRAYGFGWDGWKRHGWAEERSWFEEQVRRGRIIPRGSSLSGTETIDR